MDRGAAIPRIYPATKDGTVDGVPILLHRDRLVEKRREMGPFVFGAQMMLDPRAVALQGLGFSPVLVAMQGLLGVEQIATRGGRRHKGVRFEPYKPAVVPHNLAQLHQEDELVTDLLIALVTKEFYYGRT
jgi:hypothetical protein